MLRKGRLRVEEEDKKEKEITSTGFIEQVEYTIRPPGLRRRTPLLAIAT
jgi:hypothetical protein